MAQYIEAKDAHRDAIGFFGGFDNDDFILHVELKPAVVNIVLENCNRNNTNAEISLRSTALINLISCVLSKNIESGHISEKEACANFVNAVTVMLQENFKTDLFSVLKEIKADAIRPKGNNS